MPTVCELCERCIRSPTSFIHSVKTSTHPDTGLAGSGDEWKGHPGVSPGKEICALQTPRLPILERKICSMEAPCTQETGMRNTSLLSKRAVWGLQRSKTPPRPSLPHVDSQCQGPWLTSLGLRVLLCDQGQVCAWGSDDAIPKG